VAKRSAAWRVLTPVVCLVAGIGFAASATDSRGTELRAPGTASLVDTVRRAENRVHDADAQVRALQRQVAAAQRRAGQGNTGVAGAQAANGPLRARAGLTPLRGPGLTVILDDAPNRTANSTADPNQLVVHQSDLQAVVNALWAGGAEAMSIAGQRVIATSAVRCVGNTLLLNGEVYSPPFRVAAIGPSATMQDKLAASPGVKLFREAASYYGLVYTVDTRNGVDVPGYAGPVELNYARVAR
jgi:uncharacterized protein YlxW (UPF0749 family)